MQRSALAVRASGMTRLVTPRGPRGRPRQAPRPRAAAAAALMLILAGGATLLLWRVAERGPAPETATAELLAARSREVSDDPALALALAAEAAAAPGAAGTTATAALIDARAALARATWQPVRPATAAIDGPITDVEFSPDGASLAVAGEAAEGHGALLWDLATASMRRLLSAGTPVADIAFSPDGKTLAMAGADRGLALVDPASGESRGEPLAGSAAVAFSPDGRLLATALRGQDGTRIRLRDPTTRRWIGAAIATVGPVGCMAMSPDGRLLALCSTSATTGDGVVRLWDPNTQSPVGGPLVAHYGSVDSVAFSPDGTTLASGGADGTTWLWRLADRALIGPPLAQDQVGITTVAFNPDGDLLATGAEDGLIRLWDPATGHQVGEPLAGSPQGITAIAFSPDGALLAAGGADGTFQLWRAPDGDPGGRPLRGQASELPLPGHEGGATGLSFSPDGTRLLTTGLDSDRAGAVAQLWDPATGAAIGRPRVVGPAAGVTHSGDGRLVAASSAAATGGAAAAWWVDSGELAGPEPRDPGGRVTHVALTPDGARLASGARDPAGRVVLRMWDRATGMPVGQRLAVAEGDLTALAFSPDGLYLAAGLSTPGAGWLELVRVTGTGALAAERLPAGAGGVTALAFTRDGSLLVSGSADGAVRSWSTSSWQQVGPAMVGHRGAVVGVAPSPDGTLLASAGEDGTLRLWDTDERAALGRPLTSPAPTALAFSPAGDLLVTASRDGTVRLWDVWDPTPACDLVRRLVRAAEVAALAPPAWSGSACALP